MRTLPGLVAVVDQHAAQVRDAIADRRGRVLVVHPPGRSTTTPGGAPGGAPLVLGRRSTSEHGVS